jgi:hypothetical protein
MQKYCRNNKFYEFISLFNFRKKKKYLIINKFKINIDISQKKKKI